MPTKTSTASGLWSAGGTWVGGIAPVDNDTVVIAAGHVVDMDVDITGWANGVNGLTITGHATTPGELRCYEGAAGKYGFKLKANTTIVGTNLTAKGIFRAGTSTATPLATNIDFEVIMGSNAANSLGQVSYRYLDLKLFCSEPTIKYVQLTASAAVGATVLSVDGDVTAGSVPWRVNDYVYLATAVKTGTRTSEFGQIASMTSTTITLAAGLAYALTQYSVVAIVTRNVRFLSDSVNASQKWLFDQVGSPPTVMSNSIYAEIRNRTFTGGTGTSGSFLMSTATHGRACGTRPYDGDPTQREGGTRVGLEACFGNSTGLGVAVLNCSMLGCSYVTSGGTAVSANILVVSGQLAGTSSSFSLYGTVKCFGNLAGLYNVTGYVDSSSIVDWCELGLSSYNATRYTFAGTVQNCNFVAKSGTVTLTSSARVGSGCTSCLQLEGGSWRLNGCRFNHATPMTQYLDFCGSYFPDSTTVICRDYADSSDVPQYGYNKGWMAAGTIDRDTTPASPPSGLTDAYCTKMVHASASQLLTWDIPVVLEAGTPFSATCYLKLGSAAYSWTVAPKVVLLSDEYGFIPLDGLLASGVDSVGAAPLSNSTAWQTLYVKYTLPIASNRAIGSKVSARLRFTAQVADDTGSPYWHWNYTQNAVVNANVQYIEGDDDVAGWMAAATRGVMVVP